MKKTKILAALTAFLMAVQLNGFTPVTLVYADNGTSNEIIIYHTNDTHGYLETDGKSVVGIDKVAALKKTTPNSLLIDAGDATQGLPLASITKELGK